MTKKQITNLTFEEALNRIKQISSYTSEGKIKLEEAIKYFEESSMLKKHCDSLLQKAKFKIKKIENDINEEVKIKDLDIKTN